MASSTSRGNYYKKKTKEYYESIGYTVQITEFMCGRVISPGKVIYVKRDVFGSDGIAMNGKDIIFWNSKAASNINRVYQHKSEGIKEFSLYPFPSHVKRHVVIWEPRKEPRIIDCS